MTSTQVQIPDDLYERAARFSAEHDLSLAETVQCALELLLEREPQAPDADEPWTLPQVDIGEILIPAEKLRDLLFEEESPPHDEKEVWTRPTFDAGVLVPLDQLRDLLLDEESARGLPRE